MPEGMQAELAIAKEIGAIEVGIMELGMGARHASIPDSPRCGQARLRPEQ
jgi:hypothetical protein